MKLDVSTLKAVAIARDVPFATVVTALQDALLLAWQREHDHRRGRVAFDVNTGEVVVWAYEEAADGTEREVDATPDDFGRVATTTVRQVVTQRLREATDAVTTNSYARLAGQLVSGTIVQGGGKNVLIDLGDVEAQLPPAEQVPGERYRHGDRIRAYVLAATRGPKGPQVTVSRTHPLLVAALFDREVPEVSDGSVEIVQIAREPGHRTKIAVRSTVKGLNAKGACVGPAASRVRAVVDELHGEKVDIALWSEDPKVLVAEALTPARVLAVEVVDLVARAARVTVPEFQLSLAIGKEGQNARLAARLTGWRLDIHGDGELATGGPQLAR